MAQTPAGTSVRAPTAAELTGHSKPNHGCLAVDETVILMTLSLHHY